MPSKYGPNVERFYHSTEWRKARATKLRMAHYVCERCGKPYGIVHHKIHLDERNVLDPSIALSLDNLEVLCLECHNREHYAKSTDRRIRFDSSGNIVSVDEDTPRYDLKKRSK